MDTEEKRKKKVLQSVLGGVVGVGFLLGAMNSGAGSPLGAGLLWAFGTVLGVIWGFLALRLLSDWFRTGSEADEMGEGAGVRLVLLFVVLGAAASWGFLYLSV